MSETQIKLTKNPHARVKRGKIGWKCVLGTVGGAAGLTAAAGLAGAAGSAAASCFGWLIYIKNRVFILLKTLFFI